ncbi:hypothetical protein ZHAS_00000528 [Anopheles sinensis]|uniref:Uncharacterized protein n=1 Tax=Anopheles sinensis TaxID=74873 RepID=A0A084VA79_ANOSI|nr:hypothetical protein ZHAS_00000528 [Anopheles sinensis]
MTAAASACCKVSHVQVNDGSGNDPERSVKARCLSKCAMAPTVDRFRFMDGLTPRGHR